MFSAARKWVEYWERQATTRERALIGVLASDTTADDARASILRGIHIGRQRDAKLLSPAEAAVITAYRDMSQAHRTIVRQVFTWAEHESRQEGGTR